VQRRPACTQGRQFCRQSARRAIISPLRSGGRELNQVTQPSERSTIGCRLTPFAKRDSDCRTKSSRMRWLVS